jgi:hypothetical protein
MLQRCLIFLLVLAAAVAAGCTRTTANRGVEPRWQSLTAGQLVRGVTTRADVLQRLGPPSQVITRPGGDILYYLYEEARTRGLVLIVYNRSESVTRYDRAIFFFDGEGYLEDYSLSDLGDAGH